MSTPNVRKNSGHAALQPARRADPDQMTHDEPEIEATRMNQEALQDVGVAAQMGAPHPARVVEMRKRAFDPFAALAHQAAAASSPHPATIAIHRRPGLGILRPITSPPVRLGHVGPDTHGVQVDQGLIAVIPLIIDDLFQRLPIVNVGLRVFDLLGRGDGGLDDRRGVADIGTLQCHRDNRAGLHVDGMLGFVRQMRAAIFHLRDLRIGIVGVRPVCVRGLLLPLPIQSRQTLARGRLDPRGLRETRQKRLVALAGVPADDAAHRRVRLERRGVNRDGLALQTAGLDESLLHPRKDGPVRLQIDQAPRARNRRMIGRRLVHGQPQKAADRQRVRRAPRNPAFRVDAFEVADQQQAEVAPGCQARSAHHGRVEPVTQAFDEPIEVVPVEQRRQPRVERMARRGGQVRRRDPQRRLIRLARSHSHARQCSTTDRLCRSLITPTFTTGC